MHIAQLNETPGEGFGIVWRSSVYCQRHQVSSSLRITVQLAQVGSAAVGGETWLETEHLLECLLCAFVHPKFNGSISHQSVHQRIVRELSTEALGSRECFAKFMFASLHPSQCSQPRNRTRLKLERTSDRGFGTEVVTRIPGLTSLSHVCPSKRDIPPTLLRRTVDLHLSGSHGTVGRGVSCWG